MAVAGRNLVNLENVHKSYGIRPLLDGVSLGISAGERIGVVGRNGGGKSTLLNVLSGRVVPDQGRVTHGSDVRIATMAQAPQFDAGQTIRSFVLGDQATHEWSSDAATRSVLNALLGAHDDESLNRSLGQLSGGESRRAELARLLLSEPDLLILDEPTNHLDLEAVAWLAAYLKRSKLALLVVTHDRWFLDEVSDQTWEVVNGAVEQYEGGYSAYVLAKAERERQATTELIKRNNLIRKELAWLRRGAPARTSKPKFRIDAANQLIEAEPPPRDSAELMKFAGARLGKTVFELESVTYRIGERTLLDDVTLNIGPGDRLAIVGPNGAGKTTLLRMILSELTPESGKVVVGKTVKSAYLSQHLEELDPAWRVLSAVERVATHVELGNGKMLSASQLCERLGFGSDAQWTPVGDLSGGERRRLQLTRLLMDGPNVVVLDEPTNDFDVETLTGLEDLLDSFAGTLLVVSHDRYFTERVCDTTFGLLGDGKVRHLPRGIDEYLELRASTPAQRSAAGEIVTSPEAALTPARSAAQERTMRKELARLERAMSKADEQEAALHQQFEKHANDHQKLVELNETLRTIHVARNDAEQAWLELAEQLEDS